MASGSRFERDICYALTNWWSGGKAEDTLFWRTRASGGRATTRAKGGKKAKDAGDIYATDPSSKPLTDLITWELKNGYNHATPYDVVDRLHQKKQTYEEWIEQAQAAAHRAGTPHWAIVHHRRLRQEMLLIPRGLGVALYLDRRTGGPTWMEFRTPDQSSLFCLPFHSFLSAVKPDDVRAAWRFHIGNTATAATATGSATNGSVGSDSARAASGTRRGTVTPGA